MDEQEQQNEVQEEQQDINQVEPTPLSPPPSHKKLIIGIVAVFVLVVVAVVGAYFAFQPKIQPEEEPVACTQEAKQCPDGSYVGRIGPNCEFAECPAIEQIKDTVEIIDEILSEENAQTEKMQKIESVDDLKEVNTIVIDPNLPEDYFGSMFSLDLKLSEMNEGLSSMGLKSNPGFVDISFVNAFDTPLSTSTIESVYIAYYCEIEESTLCKTSGGVALYIITYLTSFDLQQDINKIPSEINWVPYLYRDNILIVIDELTLDLKYSQQIVENFIESFGLKLLHSDPNTI